MTSEREVWKTNRVVYRRKPKNARALLTKARLQILVVVVSLGLLYLGIYQLLHLPYFQITNIRIDGSAAVPRDEIELFLREYLSGERWGMIPKSNILLFSPRDVEAVITEQFPEVKVAVVEKKFPNGIFVTFEGRTIWAVYCGKEGEDERCAFLDREGVAFREAPVVEGSLILTFQSDREPPRLGATVIRREEAATFERFLGAFNEAGIASAGFSLNANAPKDAWLKAKEGFYVIVAKNSDPTSTASVVKTVLEKEVREKRSALEYLDARFGTKVFVKYR